MPDRDTDPNNSFVKHRQILAQMAGERNEKLEELTPEKALELFQSGKGKGIIADLYGISVAEVSAKINKATAGSELPKKPLNHLELTGLALLGTAPKKLTEKEAYDLMQQGQTPKQIALRFGTDTHSVQRAAGRYKARLTKPTLRPYNSDKARELISQGLTIEEVAEKYDESPTFVEATLTSKGANKKLRQQGETEEDAAELDQVAKEIWEKVGPIPTTATPPDVLENQTKSEPMQEQIINKEATLYSEACEEFLKSWSDFERPKLSDARLYPTQNDQLRILAGAISALRSLAMLSYRPEDKETEVLDKIVFDLERVYTAVTRQPPAF